MVSRIIKSINAPEPYMTITWQVNNFCNYSCSYCNPGNWMGDNINEQPVEQYIASLDRIINKYLDIGYKHFKFFFSGGEPTAWKNFLPICEHLKTVLPDCTIAVNTNLSRPLKWWEQTFHLFDDVVASYHIEYVKNDRYLENSIFLCDKLNYLSSKMLLHDDRFWEVVEYGNMLKDFMPNYFIEWTPLYDEMTADASPWEYKDPEKAKFIEEHSIEQQTTIDKPYKDSGVVSFTKYDDGSKVPCNSSDIIVDRNNFFRGWDCDVGDSLFISPDGRVSMASCGVQPPLGHILTDMDNIGPKTVKCTKYHCHCGTDIIIPKRKRDLPTDEVLAIGTD